MEASTPWVVDYERDVDYREYWETRGYEHWSEQIALSRLLHNDERGWLADLGAGYGRLYPVYGTPGQRAVLVDYSIKLLYQARETLGSGVPLVAANLYALPFRPHVFQAAVMFRVLHHLVAYERAFQQISRAVAQQLVLEIPNKRHLLARLRSLIAGSQTIHDWAPVNLAREPGKSFLNYHPEAVLHRLEQYGWQSQHRLSASNLRAPWLKRTLPASILRRLDYTLQSTWAPRMLGPSLVACLERSGQDVAPPPPSARDLLCCPRCLAALADYRERLQCVACATEFPVLGDQFWDLRWPRSLSS